MGNRSEILEALSRVEDMPVRQVGTRPGFEGITPRTVVDLETGEVRKREPTPVLPRVPQRTDSTIPIAEGGRTDSTPPVYRRSASPQSVDVSRSSRPRLAPTPEPAPSEPVELTPSELEILSNDELIAAMFAGRCGQRLERYTSTHGDVTIKTLGTFRKFLHGELNSERVEKKNKESAATTITILETATEGVVAMSTMEAAACAAASDEEDESITRDEVDTGIGVTADQGVTPESEAVAIEMDKNCPTHMFDHFSTESARLREDTRDVASTPPEPTPEEQEKPKKSVPSTVRSLLGLVGIRRPTVAPAVNQ